QTRQHAIDVLIAVNERDHDREFTSRLDETRRMDTMPSGETRDRVQGSRTGDVFRAQVIKDRQMQRAVLPLVGFVEVNRNLYCHLAAHFTAPSPELRRQ